MRNFFIHECVYVCRYLFVFYFWILKYEYIGIFLKPAFFSPQRRLEAAKKNTYKCAYNFG